MAFDQAAWADRVARVGAQSGSDAGVPGDAQDAEDQGPESRHHVRPGAGPFTKGLPACLVETDACTFQHPLRSGGSLLHGIRVLCSEYLLLSGFSFFGL